MPRFNNDVKTVSRRLVLVRVWVETGLLLKCSDFTLNSSLLCSEGVIQMTFGFIPPNRLIIYKKALQWNEKILMDQQEPLFEPWQDTHLYCPAEQIPDGTSRRMSCFG